MNKALKMVAAVALVTLIGVGCSHKSVNEPAATGTIGLKIAFDLTNDHGVVTDTRHMRNRILANSGPGDYRVDSVTLTSGLAMVRSVRFIATASTTVDSTITAADEQRDLGNADIQFHGPYVLLATGSMQELEATTVPVGTYQQVSFVLQKARATDDLGGHTDLVGSSIMITGKVWRNGQPTEFTFTTDYTSEIKVNGTFNVSDHFNGSLALTFDAGNWFRNGAGWVDPNDPNYRAMIIGNIRFNVKAFLVRGIRNIRDLGALN